MAAALGPLPPTLVERLYSVRVYGALQPLLTSASNLTPFALFDLLIASAAALWIGLAARDLARSGTRLRGALRVAVRTAVCASAVYLAFLVLWGFNYRRVALGDRLSFDAAAVTREAARQAAQLAGDQLNVLHAHAHAGPWPRPDEVDPALADAFARALTDIGASGAVVVARPKRSLLDWYFQRAAVEGMTDPFFLETLVSSRILPFERAFVVAHEWAHLAGIADEGEANFVGWLACRRGRPGDQYSGWLFLYSELARGLSGRDRAAIAATLDAGPRGDLQAIRDRIARHMDPRVFAASWRVYDSYLKANRVEAGAASYAEVVRLVLGVRLASGWQPLTPDP